MAASSGARAGVGSRRLLARTARRAWDDDIFSESASAAFWQTLSLPPLLLGLFGVLGYVGGVLGPDTVAAVQGWIVALTGDVFSRNVVDEIIAPTVADVLTTARGEVVSIGFVLSLWSGSSAMSAFVDAITRAHGQFQVRSFLWQRTLAVLLYLVALATGIIALPILALGPARLLPLLPDAWQGAALSLVTTLYYPGLALALVLALTTLYRVALPLKPPWHRGLPGAVLAAVLFLAAAAVLRWYVGWVTGTGYTYGALAAPIAFLLATFFIAFAVVLGAHFNASLQALWPAPLRIRRHRRHPAVGTRSVAPGLAWAVRDEPETAAAVLEELDYVVRRPAGEPGSNGSGPAPREAAARATPGPGARLRRLLLTRRRDGPADRAAPRTRPADRS